MRYLTNSSGMLTTMEIREFENRYHLTLPAAYERFLLDENGGDPKAKILDVPQWRFHSTAISCFLGIKREHGYNLETEIKRYRERIPDDCIPIAFDAGGSLLCLQTRGPQSGAVYYWDHEHESDPPNYANMYKVAPDINQLLRQMRSK